MVDELTGQHGDKNKADKVRGARGQGANQGVHHPRGQVHWVRGQMQRCIGWLRHPPSIAKLWPLLLLNW
jgi:hypothetical protein